MSDAFGHRLNRELTRVSAVRPALDSVAASVIRLARDLRSSGSDLLTEEDLCSIFSRAKIEPKLAKDFRDLIKGGDKVPVHEETSILLDSQPGATTQRALTNEYYMKTVLQLSFLCWYHERTSLATALYECMTYRESLKIPGAGSSASYEGIVGTLRAISAETGRFPWALYTGLVETQLPQSIRELKVMWPDASLWTRLASDTLLATMDCLYIVQELPQDRILMFTNQRGFLPLIVWSHYILGLTVEVQGSPDGNVKIGTGNQINVIIMWSSEFEPASKDPIFVLDSTMEVVLELPSESPMVQIESRERIPTEGYLTTHLRRAWNITSIIEDDHPAYSDCASMAIGLANCMNARCAFQSTGSQVTRSAQVSVWHILEAGELLLSGINIRRDLVNKVGKSFKKIPPREMRVTAAMRNLFTSLYAIGGTDTETETDDDEARYIAQGIVDHVIPSAILILVFAHVQKVSQCRTMPIVYGYDTLRLKDSFIEQLSKWDGSSIIAIDESDWFAQVAKLMVGRRLKHSSKFEIPKQDLEPFNFEQSFLISEYGWSVFLNTMDSVDPSQIDLNSICVRPGVPFNPEKQERKYRILDVPHRSDNLPLSQVVDKSGHYQPRSLIKVEGGKEYYSSRSQEFWHCQRYEFDNTHYSSSSDSELDLDLDLDIYPVSTYCRQLHRNLCSVFPTEPCEHEPKLLQQVKLDTDSVTVRGLKWNELKIGDHIGDYKEQIYILLTRGDSRARRIVISALHDEFNPAVFKRQVLLRGYDCCERCAVSRAAQSGGKWLIIL